MLKRLRHLTQAFYLNLLTGNALAFVGNFYQKDRMCIALYVPSRANARNSA